MRRTKRFVLNLLYSMTAFCALGCSLAVADVTVIQSGLMFLNADAAPKVEEIKKDPSGGKPYVVSQLKIKKGETITFRNDDRVTHNVYGDSFDLKAQPVGETRSQTFDHAGHYKVKCAIHPKMKFDVTVED